jgi:LysM repeat protein
MKVINDYELSQYNFPELEIEDSIQLAKESSNIQPLKDTLKKSTITSSLSDTSIRLQIVKDSINKDSITLNKIAGINNGSTTQSLNSAPTPPNSIGSLVVAEKMIAKNKDTAIFISNTFEKQKDSVVLKKYPVQYPSVRFRINDVPALWVKEGTSYLEIAQHNNIELYKLFEYNEIKESDLAEEDQLIFLGPKKKSSNKKTHIVKEGETLYSISQSEGIQLKYLLLYNILLNEKPLKSGSTVLLFNPK